MTKYEYSIEMMLGGWRFWALPAGVCVAFDIALDAGFIPIPSAGSGQVLIPAFARGRLFLI